MAGGVTDHVWDIKEIIYLIDLYEKKLDKA